MLGHFVSQLLGELLRFLLGHEIFLHRHLVQDVQRLRVLPRRTLFRTTWGIWLRR